MSAGHVGLERLIFFAIPSCCKPFILVPLSQPSQTVGSANQALLALILLLVNGSILTPKTRNCAFYVFRRRFRSSLTRKLSVEAPPRWMSSSTTLSSRRRPRSSALLLKRSECYELSRRILWSNKVLLCKVLVVRISQG